MIIEGREGKGGSYAEWDYYDSMNHVLRHRSSMQYAVVDDTLEGSKVQDTAIR